MSPIEAIFRHGVFEPLEPVNLREEQRVQLRIEPAGAPAAQAWLKNIQALQAAVLGRHGVLPDSTHDIAMDRTR